MTKAIKILSKNDEARLAVSRLFLALIACAALMYVYFAAATVMAAVKGRENIGNLRSLGRECQTVESEYLNILKAVDIDYARSLGFVDGAGKAKYAPRQQVFTKR